MMRGKARIILTTLLAVFFVFVGVFHFVKPEPFVQAVPSYVPYALNMVYISGVFEILGGLGVLVPRLRKAAGGGLILLLVSVFPANINMAANPSLFPAIPPAVLYLRLPFQGLFIYWVWYCTLKEHVKKAD